MWGAVERTEHRSGAARDQPGHAEQKAERPERLRRAGGEAGAVDARILDHLFLSAFSRYPTASERQPLLDALHQTRATTGSPEVRRDQHRQALEGMMWAMLTSKEFLFNY